MPKEDREKDLIMRSTCYFYRKFGPAKPDDCYMCKTFATREAKMNKLVAEETMSMDDKKNLMGNYAEPRG